MTLAKWLSIIAMLALPAAAYASPSVRPPIGLQLFCLKQVSSCRPHGADTIAWSNHLHVLLDRVNRNVNANIAPRSDGRVDKWRINALYGDCEDYVLTKRHKLIEHGVPAGALRVGYTRTSAGEGHAVLVVRTDRGDFVLDNLVGSVNTISASGYRIEKMSTSNILIWTSLN